MGFWDDDDTKDFSAFGIMANSGFPTPDAFLVKEVADQNTTYNNPYDFGNSAYTYTPPDYYNTSSDDIELKGTPTTKPSPFTEQDLIRVLTIKNRLDIVSITARLTHLKKSPDPHYRNMYAQAVKEKEELTKELNEILERYK